MTGVDNETLTMVIALEEIPHIASVMYETVEGVLVHAEVLVIGNAGRAGHYHVVADLTWGEVGRPARATTVERAEWAG